MGKERKIFLVQLAKKKRRKGLVSVLGHNTTKVKWEKGSETSSEDIPVTEAPGLAATSPSRSVVELLAY